MPTCKNTRLIQKGSTWLGFGLSIQARQDHNSRACTRRFSKTKLKKLKPRKMAMLQGRMAPLQRPLRLLGVKKGEVPFPSRSDYHCVGVRLIFARCFDAVDASACG